MEYTIFFSTYLVFLTACLASAEIKWKYRPDHMNREDLKKYFPCRNKFIRLYLLQIIGLPYLWLVEDSSALILVNATLVGGFASVLGYAADIYYFGQRKSFLKSVVYYAPIGVTLGILFLEAVLKKDFIPDWAAILIVILVSCRYMYKQMKICIKIGRLITNVQKGQYAEISDFPFKQARVVQWTPIIFTSVAIVILIANNPWVNSARDLILAYLGVRFMVYTMNSKKKTETNYVLTNGESIGTATVKKSMSDKKFNELKEALDRVMDEDQLFLDQHIDMNKLQKAIGTNRNYIYEVIGRSGQGSFYEMINRRRVEYAKALMAKQPEMLLADVAESSGFCSPSAMSKAFKNYAGIAPSKYAAQIREK